MTHKIYQYFVRVHIKSITKLVHEKFCKCNLLAGFMEKVKHAKENNFRHFAGLWSKTRPLMLNSNKIFCWRKSFYYGTNRRWVTNVLYTWEVPQKMASDNFQSAWVPRAPSSKICLKKISHPLKREEIKFMGSLMKKLQIFHLSNPTVHYKGERKVRKMRT